MSQMWQIKVVFVLLVYDLFRFNVKFSVRLVGALVITFSRLVLFGDCNNVYRNITDKAKYLKDICKEQITVFREATLFANAEAECPNRTSRVLGIVLIYSNTCQCNIFSFLNYLYNIQFEYIIHFF